MATWISEITSAMTATTQEMVAIDRFLRETLSASMDNDTLSSAFSCASKFGSDLTPSLSIACKIASGVRIGRAGFAVSVFIGSCLLLGNLY
jgi:hypothetical protein